MKVCGLRLFSAYMICVLVALSPGVWAQQFVPAAKGSKVEFKLTSHRDGEEVIKGRLGGLKGKIIFDPKSLDKASFDITLGAGSVTTGNAVLDNIIKNEPFFNSGKHPLIHLKSTSITQEAGSIVYVLQGNLTMKGVTKPVKIQFMATPMAGGYLFRGSLEVSRLAFNNGTKDDKIDDMVSVFIEVRTSKG